MQPWSVLGYSHLLPWLLTGCIWQCCHGYLLVITDGVTISYHSYHGYFLGVSECYHGYLLVIFDSVKWLLTGCMTIWVLSWLLTGSIWWRVVRGEYRGQVWWSQTAARALVARRRSVVMEIVLVVKECFVNNPRAVMDLVLIVSRKLKVFVLERKKLSEGYRIFITF